MFLDLGSRVDLLWIQPRGSSSSDVVPGICWKMENAVRPSSGLARWPVRLPFCGEGYRTLTILMILTLESLDTIHSVIKQN